MTDYSDLKRMAECATGFTDMSLAPDVVLGLIAENESLKHAVSAGAAREWDLRSQVTNAKESRARVVLSNKALRAEHGQFKAENETLRKVANELRRWASCEHLHHDKVDQHGTYEPCKVLARIDNALSKEG